MSTDGAAADAADPTASSSSLPTASPPLHAAMSGSYRPKKQTLARFFRRYPYGERRSRAVAPAETTSSGGGSSATARRRRAGTGKDLTKTGAATAKPHNRMRLAVGEFMRQLYVEFFFVMIVLAYGVFVVIQITVGDSALTAYKSIIDVTDVTVGCILFVEISLKVFAYGRDYLRDFWNLFDAVVIVASFVLSVLAATGSQSTILTKVLRLRVILRILRVLVVFERIKQRSRAMNFVHKGPITSPVEHVLRLLNELRFHPGLKRSICDEIEFAIDAIKNNRLYDANEALIGEEVDNDTQMWLRGEILKVNDTNKVLADVTEGNEHPDHHHHLLHHRRRRSSTDGAAATTDDSSSNGFEDGGAHHIKRGVTMKELLPPLDAASEFELQSLLRDVNKWSFDIFRVNVISGGNALCQVGYHLLHEIASSSLQIDQIVLVNFLLEIQRGYIATNPYHNSIHAADVMQTVFFFLIQPELAPFLRPLDRALALIAAGIHDFKHDGFNNSFHISTASEIALRYNDHAVLENFHVAQSFLVMKNPDFNVLGKLAPEDFKYSREMLIQMVLATDMAKHFEDVSLFKTNILPAADQELMIKNVGDKKLLLKMILHTCDVSNPSKEREIMLKWTERVVEEFFVQGEMEKQLSLAVSPFMDRDTIVIKKMQVGFADFIVTPLFSIWAQILPSINTGAYKTLLANREFWSSLSEEFKPSMIKDVIKELGSKKRISMISEEPSLTAISANRVRRSVANLILSSEDG